MPGLEQLSDEALVRRTQGGDHAAFRVLSERYAAKLRVHIGRRLVPGMRRKVGASDILQEAHFVALQRCGDFEDRGAGSFGRWFRKIVDLKIGEAVRRYAGTDKRKLAQEVSRDQRGPTGLFAGREPSPSQVIAGRELEDRARSALAELPQDYCEVLCLLQEERVTVEEAARRMDRSKAAVRKLYGRALARLEELLDVQPGPNGERRRPTR